MFLNSEVIKNILYRSYCQTSTRWFQKLIKKHWNNQTSWKPKALSLITLGQREIKTVIIGFIEKMKMTRLYIKAFAMQLKVKWDEKQ